MKIFTILSATFLLVASNLSAAVIYQFSVTGTNRATGFANAAGTPTDNMRWGLVFDTSGNGFSGFTGNGNAPNSGVNGQYDFISNVATSGFLNAGGLATDDYYWVPTNASLLTQTLSAAGSDPGGAGGILTAQGAPVGTDSLPSGLNTNDKFAIIWFDGTPAAGSSYGLFTDASFLLPGSGAGPFPFSAPFVQSPATNADPAKPANLTFTSAAPIPEPSRMMLLGFGLVGLFFRRRR